MADGNEKDKKKLKNNNNNKIKIKKIKNKYKEIKKLVEKTAAIVSLLTA